MDLFIVLLHLISAATGAFMAFGPTEFVGAGQSAQARGGATAEDRSRHPDGLWRAQDGSRRIYETVLGQGGDGAPISWSVGQPFGGRDAVRPMLDIDGAGGVWRDGGTGSAECDAAWASAWAGAGMARGHGLGSSAEVARSIEAGIAAFSEALGEPDDGRADRASVRPAGGAHTG